MACNNNDVDDDTLSLSGQPSTSTSTSKSNQGQGGHDVREQDEKGGKSNTAAPIFNLKCRRHSSHSNPKPNPSNSNIPAECAYISVHEDEEDESEREYLLAAAERTRSELVHRLQQQIRKQEIVLANKMKEVEARRKNDALSEFVRPGQKRHAPCWCCNRWYW